MSQLSEHLLAAQKKGLSIRPKVGGFPVLAEVLREAGVHINSWSLPSCQSVFLMDDGAVVQQGTPLVTGTHDVPEFDEEALIEAIRADQKGKMTFQEFLQAAWSAGVIGYDADFMGRKVSYFGTNGESYEEEYPAVDLKTFRA